jgi:hypothetical protein
MASAVLLATLAAFLLVGASYLLFPEPTLQEPPIPMPIPKPTPEPEPLEEISLAIGWIGLAAGVASATVAAMLLGSHLRTRKTQSP